MLTVNTKTRQRSWARARHTPIDNEVILLKSYCRTDIISFINSGKFIFNDHFLIFPTQWSFGNSFTILSQKDHLSNINFKRLFKKENSKQILSSQYEPHTVYKYNSVYLKKGKREKALDNHLTSWSQYLASRIGLWIEATKSE